MGGKSIRRKPLGGTLCPFPVTDASTELLGAGGAEKRRGVRRVLGAQAGGQIKPHGGLCNGWEIDPPEAIGPALRHVQHLILPVQIRRGKGAEFGVLQSNGQQ